jgi:hypothetical protein
MAVKKAVRKRAGETKAARGKTTRRKGTRKKTTRRAFSASRLESELPRSLRDFSRHVRRDLAKLEKQIESGRREARRRLTRLVRDASHLLGRIEARGPQGWRRLSGQALREAEGVLRRIRKAIE